MKVFDEDKGIPLHSSWKFDPFTGVALNSSSILTTKIQSQEMKGYHAEVDKVLDATQRKLVNLLYAKSQCLFKIVSVSGLTVEQTHKDSLIVLACNKPQGFSGSTVKVYFGSNGNIDVRVVALGERDTWSVVNKTVSKPASLGDFQKEVLAVLPTFLTPKILDQVAEAINTYEYDPDQN